MKSAEPMISANRFEVGNYGGKTVCLIRKLQCSLRKMDSLMSGRSSSCALDRPSNINGRVCARVSGACAPFTEFYKSEPRGTLDIPCGGWGIERMASMS